MRLFLMGTRGCHLCEQAEQIINECLPTESEGCVIEIVDIAEHADWHDKYALEIPVLCNPEANQSLTWPFDHRKAREFILRAKQYPLS